jgi:Na+-translocating ferredoxin:NAD+ oxidoreductase RnfG subunit
MNKGLVSGLVLLSLGLLCGILLSAVNYFTAPKIKEVEDAIKYEALSGFYTLANYDLSEVEGTGNFGTIFILKAKGTEDIQAIVYTVSTEGYSGVIEMLIAVNEDLSVEGYAVTKQTETPGLGDKIVGHDFNVDTLTDLSNFDGVAGASDYSSPAVKQIFQLVSERVEADLGGGLSE